MNARGELLLGKYLFKFQTFSIILLGVAGVGIALIQLFFPSFFVYPYLRWGGWESVLRFWPAYAWCVALTLIFSVSRLAPARPLLNTQIFLVDMLTSVIAGVWEELGYRYVFICFAMIGLALANWFFSVGLGWGLALALGVGGVVLLFQKEFLLGGLCAIGAVLAGYYGHSANVIYWFYEYVIVNIIHFTTFTLMDPVLYGTNDKLFLFGALLANVWFRDGHKYQGPVGIVNSWYMGMVLLYATVTYGLFTAIVVHAVYDILIGVVRFAFRPMFLAR